jgi:hypothetical protein
MQLYRLIDERRLEELSDVGSNGATPEARALGIIGLYKLGRYSRPAAKTLLLSLAVPLTTCSGCIVSDVMPEDLVELLDAPSPVQLAEHGQEWRTPTNALELPGMPRSGPDAAPPVVEPETPVE